MRSPARNKNQTKKRGGGSEACESEEALGSFVSSTEGGLGGETPALSAEVLTPGRSAKMGSRAAKSAAGGEAAATRLAFGESMALNNLNLLEGPL